MTMTTLYSILASLGLLACVGCSSDVETRSSRTTESTYVPGVGTITEETTRTTYDD
jgi:hypothetical protein